MWGPYKNYKVLCTCQHPTHLLQGPSASWFLSPTPSPKQLFNPLPAWVSVAHGGSRCLNTCTFERWSMDGSTSTILPQMELGLKGNSSKTH